MVKHDVCIEDARTGFQHPFPHVAAAVPTVRPSVFSYPKFIEYIMTKHGFALEKKHIFADGHSLFYAFSYKGQDSDALPKL